MFRSVNQARVKALVLSFSNTLYAPRARARAHAPWFTFTTYHSTQQPLLNLTSLHSFYILPFIPHPCIHSKMLPFTTACRILLSYPFIHSDIPSLDLNFRMRPCITSFILTPRRACERWSRHARVRELPHLGSLTQFAFIPTAELNPTSLHSSHTLPCIPHPFIHPRMLPFTTTCFFLLSYSFIHFHILHLT